MNNKQLALCLIESESFVGKDLVAVSPGLVGTLVHGSIADCDVGCVFTVDGEANEWTLSGTVKDSGKLKPYPVNSPKPEDGFKTFVMKNKVFFTSDEAKKPSARGGDMYAHFVVKQ